MVASWDEDDSGEIELEEFMAIFSMAKENEQRHDDTDTLAAFVAMGGNDDFTGRVSVQKLLATIQEFELVVDLGAMLQKADRDNSGHIDYSEFKMLLSH